MAKELKHTLSVLVENRPGVLARVAGLFARRGFNIHSLAVSATEQPDISRMTIVTPGDEGRLQQVVSQLNKLIDVIHILDHTHDALVMREIALVKVRALDDMMRKQVGAAIEKMSAKVAQVGHVDGTMMLECTGEEEVVDNFIESLHRFEILELVRSGKIALASGSKAT